MTFGQKLYTLREKNGWSQDELAEKAEVSRQTVSNWENDKVQIDAEKLKRLAEIFGVGMDELYGSDCTPSGKKTKPIALIAAIVAMAAAVAALVLAIVGLCNADYNKTSSVITLNGSFGLFFVLVLSVVVLGFCTALLVKTFKKK